MSEPVIDAGPPVKPKRKAKVYPPPTPQNRRKIGFKVKMGLLEVIKRKRFSDRVDYRAINIQTGVPVQTLKQTYSYWKQGAIDMGEPTSEIEEQIDARQQHKTNLHLVRRYKALLLTSFEQSLFDAEDRLLRGDVNGWKDLGLDGMLTKIERTLRIQTYLEKGFLAMIEEYGAAKTRDAAQLANDPVVSTEIINASEEEKFLTVLREHYEKRVPGADPIEVPGQNGG